MSNPRHAELEAALAQLQADRLPMEQELDAIRQRDFMERSRRRQERLAFLDAEIARLQAERHAILPLNVYVVKMEGRYSGTRGAFFTHASAMAACPKSGFRTDYYVKEIPVKLATDNLAYESD